MFKPANYLQLFIVGFLGQQDVVVTGRYTSKPTSVTFAVSAAKSRIFPFGYRTGDLCQRRREDGLVIDVINDGIDRIGDSSDSLSEHQDHVPIQSRRNCGSVPWNVVQVLARSW